MKRQAPPTEQVTTEPQRLALEAMSQDLVKKLNCMVAEQEARAREFAAHQHSLSSLPVQTPPVAPTTTYHKPKQKHYHKHTAPPQPPTYTPPTYTQTIQTPASSYTDTYLPPVPSASPAPRKKTPTVIGGRKKKEEEGVGVGTIITIIFIVFILMSRGCS
ncbi:MAG: hypothetical protein IJA81_01850 [Akkermansia sp.]|nr:hypothetical protein [Akkermansia sp.]